MPFVTFTAAGGHHKVTVNSQNVSHIEHLNNGNNKIVMNGGKDYHVDDATMASLGTQMNGGIPPIEV